MSKTVIKVEELAKLYRLGDVGTGTLSHDLKRWWYKARGKEDPFSSLAETNIQGNTGSSDYVWALKDIDFDVQQGDVLGVVGRNGAGKSTLLKILSRTTNPSQGAIKIRGRVASLLEVGTGFHPELTGKENIYLNGAILGMRKKEITKKLDEIIDFAGVERYIDTPVKRYSSGMYVRLAFAVAAHLESEILIVDEVLAVGDAEFQKKCLGKMGDVSRGEGRTVLFVSHNMPAVRALCKRGILLENGRLALNGDIDKVIGSYLTHGQQHYYERSWTVESAPQDEVMRLREVRVFNNNSEGSIVYREEDIYIEIQYEVLRDHDAVSTSIGLKTEEAIVFVAGTKAGPHNAGLYKMHFVLPRNLMNDTEYQLSVVLVTNYNCWNVEATDILRFSVNEREERDGYIGKMIGYVRPAINWSEPVQIN